MCCVNLNSLLKGFSREARRRGLQCSWLLPWNRNWAPTNGVPIWIIGHSDIDLHLWNFLPIFFFFLIDRLNSKLKILLLSYVKYSDDDSFEIQTNISELMKIPLSIWIPKTTTNFILEEFKGNLNPYIFESGILKTSYPVSSFKLLWHSLSSCYYFSLFDCREWKKQLVNIAISPYYRSPFINRARGWMIGRLKKWFELSSERYFHWGRRYRWKTASP